MENIGPVVLFLLYMVISSWAKQKKNRAVQERKDDPLSAEPSKASQTVSKVESIFDQIKKELFEEEVEPPAPFMEYYEPFQEQEEEQELIPEEDPEPEIVEGSSRFEHHDHLAHIREAEPVHAVGPRNPLKGILGAYSTTQQGIILREILGKPRALQDNNDWFHNS